MLSQDGVPVRLPPAMQIFVVCNKIYQMVLADKDDSSSAKAGFKVRQNTTQAPWHSNLRLVSLKGRPGRVAWVGSFELITLTFIQDKIAAHASVSSAGCPPFVAWEVCCQSPAIPCGSCTHQILSILMLNAVLQT